MLALAVTQHALFAGEPHGMMRMAALAALVCVGLLTYAAAAVVTRRRRLAGARPNARAKDSQANRRQGLKFPRRRRSAVCRELCDAGSLRSGERALMDDLAREPIADGLLSPHPSASLADPAAEPSEQILWANRVRGALARQSGTALGIAEDALRKFPGEFELLLLAALAALAAGHPVRALGFIRRHQKRYVPGKAVSLLLALAFAQQRQFPRAWAMLRMNGIDTLAYRGSLVRRRGRHAALAS